MAQGLKEARRELARGDEDAALALLWNALEPARLSGDRRALRTIEGMAGHIAREGDEAHRREAERLVVAVQRVAEAPGTAEVGAQVSTGGAPPPPEQRGDVDEAEPAAGSGAQRIASLVWILVLIAVVIVNVLGRGQ